jgi:ketosteroid isomerase-like protein
MAADTELIQLEEGFWRAAGDPERYAAALAPDAVHVFPGMGIADRELVLEGVDRAAQWSDFSLADVRFVRLGEDAAALVYTARGERSGREPYVAAITSVYRREGDGWKLVIHQQTPV